MFGKKFIIIYTTWNPLTGEQRDKKYSITKKELERTGIKAHLIMADKSDRIELKRW